ncbi:MAG: phenylalanine--tRNA ligase subunit alpha [bacterium]
MVKIDLNLLKKQAQKEIDSSGDLQSLNLVFKKYLGKQGELIFVLKSLSKLPKDKRAKVGQEANKLKQFLSVQMDQRQKELKDKIQKEAEEKEWIDITAPGYKTAIGHLHPLTQVKRQIMEIFQLMGFSVVEGPEMETEWYNFDALNIPKNHPARDLWDTFYLKNGLLLRAHTSPVQIRYMEKHQPPLKIIAPGRVFRHEATDASHESNFHQLEGLMIDKTVSVANFKAIIEEFFRRFFNKPVKIRLIPSFFPFVEPGFQVDMSCLNCGGKGCSSCRQTGWLEMMGAGMVHPNVLKAGGLVPKNWQGFAFGMGMDRLAMMKYKITDIRLSFSGDLRFLKQF